MIWMSNASGWVCDPSLLALPTKAARISCLDSLIVYSRSIFIRGFLKDDILACVET
jgi:hypothetical protein